MSDTLEGVGAPWQWQVVQAQLDPVRGSEQAGRRPALIVSREAANRALYCLGCAHASFRIRPSSGQPHIRADTGSPLARL